MSKAIDELRRMSDEFDKTPEGHDMDMRLDVAAIIWKEINRRKWTGREYAKRVGFTDVHVCNIIHANVRLTTASIAKLMQPFGIRLRLVKVRKP